MTDSEPDLPSLDTLDRQIIELLKKRCEASREQIAAVPLPQALAHAEKLASALTGPGSHMQITGNSPSPRQLSPQAMSEIMRHIVSACYQAARPISAAFLGPVDSYSHLAATAFFGDAAELKPVLSIGAVFDSVQRGDSELGIVPIENSTDGRVVDTLGRLTSGQANIVGEVLMSIRHNLLSQSKLGDITEVHSKPQALSQCRAWLASHLPDARLVESASTTAAAMAAAKTPGIAAVASLQAGRRYGLNVIAESIEDNRDNVTRFAVLGAHPPEPTGADKTTLLFQVDHRPGALADTMLILKEYGLNLTWIESFPQAGTPNEYFFVVEFPGHRQDANVAQAIASLQERTRHVDVLGSYPRGRRV